MKHKFDLLMRGFEEIISKEELEKNLTPEEFKNQSRI